jgi:hypothetical protein
MNLAEKKLQNYILGEPQLQLRTHGALLLTVSRRLEYAPLSRTFSTCCGFATVRRISRGAFAEPRKLPAEGPIDARFAVFSS